MRIPRVFTETPLAPAAEAELPPLAAHHVHTVLRLRVGAELTLFDGRGGEYPARLLSVHRRGASVEVGAHLGGKALVRWRWRGSERIDADQENPA